MTRAPVRLRRFFEWFLPGELVLRWRLRRIDRDFRPRLRELKGDEREWLAHEHAIAQEEVVEDFDLLLTRRLLRKARRYYVLPPPMPKAADQDDYEGNEHWNYLHVAGGWSLTPAGIAFVQRQIEDAQARRRQKWETWSKIVGGLISGLVALGSVIVSLILALRR